MSRKTSHNASKSTRPGALSRFAYAKIGFLELALGAFLLGIGGAAHAQNSPIRTKRSEPPAALVTVAPRKRRRFNATPSDLLASVAPNGDGLYTQNSVAPSSIIGNANPIPSRRSSATALAPIVVTGIRGSLLRSLAIKRESIGVVDAISAESIGQFPDSSVGGALAHLPGVTINRGALSYTNGAGAATATGLAQGVNVNGFGGNFDTVLVDGRQIASGNGQVFNFSGIGAMYVGQIDVLKTPDMALSSGNIGSVINVKMLDPFDNPGLHADMNVGGTDYTMDGGVRPAVGALFSDTFDHNRFGILVDGDYTDHHTLTHHQDITGWKGTASGSFPCSDLAANYTTAFGSTNCASVGSGAKGDAQIPVWYPQSMNMYLERVDTRSKDGRVVLQWHPARSLMVTLDDNYSSWDQHLTNWELGTFFASHYPGSTLDRNGTISSFNYPGENDFNAYVNDEYIVTNTYGLNVLWDVNDDWTLELDADQSVSQYNPNGGHSVVSAAVSYAAAGSNTGGLVLNQNGNVLPYWSDFGATSGTSSRYLNFTPFIVGPQNALASTQQNTDQINEATLRATWTPGHATTVTFGAQFLDDTWNTKSMSDQTNNYWKLWGQGFNLEGVTVPSSLFSAVKLGTWMPGYGGNDNMPADLVLFNPYSVINYLETQPIDSTWKPSPGYPRYTGGFPAEALTPGSVQHVSRMNYSPFVQATHNFRVDGMKLMTRLGLRYERTEEVIAGLNAPLLGVAWEGAVSPTAYVFDYGPPTWITTTRSYGYFLPALDLALWPTHNLETAFDFSRTEAAPTNGDLVPNTTYSGRVNALAAKGNDPGLLPYLSNNYDFRFTWFYAHGDYAEIHPFYKQVSDFPTSSVQDVTEPFNDPAPCSYSSGGVVFTDPNCGKPMVFAESTLTNKLSADVTGVSATWQQLLPYGFGIVINGTWMHSNANFNNYGLTANQFALPGVGNSANGTLFYQRGKWQARVTVNWQAKLLLFLGQQSSGGAFGAEPVYEAPFTQLDFATNYQIDKYFNVYFTAQNLLNSIYHTYGRFPNQTLDLVNYGTSVSFGLRAKF
jgi:TonB-dependent receptor